LKLKATHIDKVALPLFVLLILGITSSYFNFGAVSVVASVLLPVLFVCNLIIVVFAIEKRRYIYIVGIITFLFCFDFFFQYTSVDKTQESNIQLLSYNVRAFADEDQNVASDIVRFIDSVNPDILLLQESTYKVGRTIKGFDYHFLGYRQGVEKTLLDIYSKFPIVNQGHVDFPDTKNNTIFADIKILNDTIRIYNTHLQSFAFTSGISKSIPDKFSNTLKKQIEQSKIVNQHVKTSQRKAIIAGDLNATPYALPYKILSKERNDSFVAKGNGLGTTYKLHGYPLRLDHAFFDLDLKITQHKNFDLNLSDHQPILIAFEIPKISRS